MRSLGVIAQEEIPSTSELTDAMYAANDVLDSWGPQVLPVLPILVEQFPLTGNILYTMGVGGTFNTVRPVKIETVAVVATNGARRAARIGTVEEWTSLPDITLSGLFADLCYIDNGYPMITLALMPKPVGGVIEIHSYKPLTAFMNLTDTVNLAPGYTRALRWALAFEMAPEYNRSVTQELASLAADAKTAITGLNQAVLGRPNQVEPTSPPVPAQQAPVQS